MDRLWLVLIKSRVRSFRKYQYFKYRQMLTFFFPVACTVEDQVLPGARVLITRQQCEALREPLVAEDGSVTQRVQNVQFDLSGDQFRTYNIRPPYSAFNDASTTAFRIGAKFDDIITQQPELVRSSSVDPSLFRGYTFLLLTPFHSSDMSIDVVFWQLFKQHYPCYCIICNAGGGSRLDRRSNRITVHGCFRTNGHRLQNCAYCCEFSPRFIARLIDL
jgi:hypothetical protein